MDIEEVVDKYLGEDKEGTLPRGWTRDSIEKFSKSIGKTPEEKGFFKECVLHLGKSMDTEQANGTCANIIDSWKGNTNWRSGKGHKGND